MKQDKPKHEEPAPRGRARKYASAAERQAAYRARLKEREGVSTGEVAESRGRPRKYATAAERQAAYRERLKERGLREITRVVRDTHADELKSDIIDLSACRKR